MLRPFKVVDTVVFVVVMLKYEVGKLSISKNKETNRFQIFGYNNFTDKDNLLTELSVYELRYCCSFLPALLQAVWDYYDKEGTTINDISFVGIPKEFDISQLMNDFNSSCSLAIIESNNIDETLDAIEDQIDMLKNELDIFRTYLKLKSIKQEGGN